MYMYVCMYPELNACNINFKAISDETEVAPRVLIRVLAGLTLIKTILCLVKSKVDCVLCKFFKLIVRRIGSICRI